MCFSEKYSRGYGGFKLIIDGVYGVFIVENWTTTVTSKMKEIGVFGAEKRKKILAGHELGKNLSEEEVWVDILPLKDNIIMYYVLSLDKIVHIFWRDYVQIIYIFLHIIRLTSLEIRTTNMVDVLAVAGKCITVSVQLHPFLCRLDSFTQL